MKKILAMLLAVMMLLSVASIAMAEPTDAPATPTYSDHGTVTLTKTYKLVGDGVSPAETFKYTIEKVSVTDAASTVTKENMPVPTFADGKGEITFNSGEAVATTGTSKNLTINLPTYESVGVYTYTIKETSSKTLGVIYDETAYTLVVTVIHGGNGLIREVALRKTGADTKSEAAAFENTYTANKLSVTKNVTGKLGDQSKKFKFVVRFNNQNPNNTEMKSTVTATIAGAEDSTFSFSFTEDYTFELFHGQTAVFANLPAGITYKVFELDENNEVISDTEKQMNGNYTVSYDNDKEGLTNGTAKQTTITNTYEGSIDTGVMLDSMPYVLVLAVVGAAVIALIAKKRRAED